MPIHFSLFTLTSTLGSDVLLPVGTLLGSLTIPIYILAHLLELASMKPGTKGWNPRIPGVR